MLSEKQVNAFFKEYQYDTLSDDDKQDGPLVREMYNNYVDSMQRDGEITSEVADNMACPFDNGGE